MLSSYRKMRLKAGKDRSVKNYHPWIFSGAFEQPDREGIAGEVVEVFDSEGNYMATGHYHPGTIMVRVISFDQCVVDDAFWVKKLNLAHAFRKELPGLDPAHTNTYRLVHGEGDHLPGLIIDLYARYAVIQTHSSGMAQSISSIAEALQQVLDLDGIYHKQAYADGISSPILGDTDESEVIENEIRFIVNWKTGQKTGFFLDQRENRKLLSSYAKGKKVLNTFSYSGGFSLYALKAGASLVHSIDSSAGAIEMAMRNVDLNNIDPVLHQGITEDVFRYLKQNTQKYDVVILDPPAFAKHNDALNQALNGYRNLNYEALRQMPANSILFTFSCSQAVSKDEFRKAVFKASARAGRQVRILHQLSQPADHPINIYHPEGEYLKGLVLHVS